MPIKIPNDLPATSHLEDEGLVVMKQSDAVRQDIRPMRIALLNLMPHKIKTEIQLARLIGGTPLQVELTLLMTSSYTPTNTPLQHMLDFYRPWPEIREEKFDGLIVTGAPIERLPFRDVIYWEELTEIFDWTQTHVTTTLNLCWGAQAALNHFYGVPKHELPKKMFGVFPHRVARQGSSLLRGFDDEFLVPVSRYTEVRTADLPQSNNLEVLAESDEAGLCLIQDHARRHVYMFNHLEYDAQTLGDEYRRDEKAGLNIRLPANYFPGNDPAKPPRNNWRSHAHLMISNWIHDMYQESPYDTEAIGNRRAIRRHAS